MQKNIKIILLSDIHSSKENITRVSEWISQKEIDYIFLLGDFLNLPNLEKPLNMKIDEAMTKSLIEEENNIKDLLKDIHQLNIPTFYIPGNHDPISMFDETHQPLFPGFHNVQNKIFKLQDDLQILGFGGSIPGYSGGQQVWTGFPFSNEQEFEDKFQAIEKEFKGQGNIQTIMMTHVGPSISSTTQSITNDLKIIESGSKYLSKFLLSNVERVVVNVHGHTHDGHGYRRINDLQVVNGGPLLWEKFTIIELRKKNDKWELFNVSLLTL